GVAWRFVVMTESSLTTTADGARIAFDVYGTPTACVPVVCIPGLTRNAADFEEVGARLCGGRQVVAVDLRGRGRSSTDATAASYHFAQYADDVVAVCDAVGIQRAALIGTSLGGLVATHLGVRAPSRVAGLVLNDIGPTIEPEGAARITATVGTLGPVTN